jgi:hypothetical protein
MSNTAIDELSEDQSPEVIDAPASSKVLLPLLPVRSAEVAPAERAAELGTVLRVETLSREVGWLLITAGIIGFIIPGVLGTPFLLAGALVVVPGGPKLLSRWTGRNPAKFVDSATRQIGRFLDDLERRYPHN